MNINKDCDWNLLTIGFWTGVAVISLINIALMVLHRNQFLYDEYIFVISLIGVIVYAIIRSRSPRQ
jgi:multisubunit Na+/H+ antiporter MnhE subunit